MQRIAWALALSAVTAVPALAGPPWVSVEIRAHRSGTHGSWLVLHTFHHADAVGYPLRGTAVGLVNGIRTELPLTFRGIETDRQSGAFVVQQAWAEGSPWVLNIRLEDGDHMGAGVVVGVGASGEPMFIRFPRTVTGVTRAATAAEVDRLLASLAEGPEPPRLARGGGPILLLRVFGPPVILIGTLVTSLAWLAITHVRRVRMRRQGVAVAVA